MAVFEYMKLITAKHYKHLCMGISIDQEDCGSQVLVRLDTNLASHSDGTIRDVKTKYADAVAHLDENNPVKWFGNVLRQQQVLLHYRIGTTTVEAMEDAVHRIQACTGPTSALSVEIATWRITTAATKATGTVLTEADEVLSFEAMLRSYNEKTKHFQANDCSAGGEHFKPPFKTFSTDACEPCQWCLKNLNKKFLRRGKIAAIRIDHLKLMETRKAENRPSASSAKSKAIGSLLSSGDKFSGHDPAAGRKGQHRCTPGCTRLCCFLRHDGRKRRPLLYVHIRF